MRLMASPRSTYPNGFRFAFAVTILVLTLSFQPSKSDGIVFSRYGEALKERKPVLGSRPPLCINKCSSCRPCKATLVSPPHRHTSFKASSSSSRDEEDTYYLLSWKCRCGDKLYQP